MKLPNTQWLKGSTRKDLLSAFASTLLACAGGGFLAGFAVAQGAETTAPGRQGPAKSYLNKQLIQLPIMIDEKARPLVQEIQLYIKDQPSAPWTLREKASSAQTAFTFQAPKDGEYWFTMVTVDTKGQRFPADLTREEPSLVVVVDSQLPQIELSGLGETPEGLLVQCDIQDAALDPVKTRFQYQTADKQYRNLEPLSGRPNVFCIPAQANTTGQIRVVAIDLASNLATHQSSVQELASAMPTAAQPMQPIQRTNYQEKVQEPITPQVIEMTRSATPKALPTNLLASATVAPKLPKAPATSAVNAIIPELPPYTELEQRPSTETPLATSQQRTSIPAKAAKTPLATTNVLKREAAAQRQLVNTPHVSLDYQIEQTGPSGVGRVEVWTTRDAGKSWQKLCEDSDRKSPADVELPGEGLFGVTLVLSNGRGFGATPPKAGDAADWWIEVDTSKPVGQLLSVHGRPEDGAALQIAWKSSDKNLAADGVELFYAAAKQGPWHSIAKGLKSEGWHAWTVPADVGPSAFLRMTVRDAAGNTSVAETPQPVVLDDQSRPRARLTGIVSTQPSDD